MAKAAVKKVEKNIKTITEAKTQRDIEAKELLQEYFEQLEIQKKAEARQKQIKEQLEKKYTRVNFDTLILECYKVMRVKKDGTKFDTAKFKAENETLYKKYSSKTHSEYIQLDTVKESTKVK